MDFDVTCAFPCPAALAFDWLFEATAFAIPPSSIGYWLDQERGADKYRRSAKPQWILLAVFTAISVAASSIPESWGGYVSYLPMGILVWAIFGFVAFAVSRRHKARIT
jgi:hypothetical protein